MAPCKDITHYYNRPSLDFTKSTWDATYRQTRVLFTFVVAPRMDYAAIVWHRPKKEGHALQSTQLTKMETAQRTAMKAILGFCTTAASSLEIELTLEPPIFESEIRYYKLSRECKLHHLHTPSHQRSSFKDRAHHHHAGIPGQNFLALLPAERRNNHPLHAPALAATDT